ncbi:MAG: GntR family transcriptional regulator [Saprospiraceae bacterium]
MTKEAGYLRVQRKLKKMIILGEYAIGDMLPSESMLTEEYKLSRMTIRHALKNLEVEGLIYRKKGKGSFVGNKKRSFELGFTKGFTEIMKSRNINYSTNFIQEPILQEWPEDFRWKLSNKEIKNNCIYFSRSRSIEGKKVIIDNTIISNIGVKNFCEKPLVNMSLFDTLMVRYDTEITGVTQKFSAIIATKEMAKSIEIKEGDPVLRIIRKLSTSNPGLHIYADLYCDTNSFSFDA